MEQDEEFTNSPKHKLQKIFRTQFLVINWFQRRNKKLPITVSKSRIHKVNTRLTFFLIHCLIFGQHYTHKYHFCSSLIASRVLYSAPHQNYTILTKKEAPLSIAHFLVRSRPCSVHHWIDRWITMVFPESRLRNCLDILGLAVKVKATLNLSNASWLIIN